jgi:AAA+ ATPase superfamily predicted ATPase
LKKKIIGRNREQKLLKEAFNSPRAELIAVYGRRRIGKTYLIKTLFEQEKSDFFYCSGIQHGKLKDQLHEFAKHLSSTFYNDIPIKTPQSWMEAFETLQKTLASLPKKQKVVIFFDELPWMATPKSGLLTALDYYWNRYWSHNDNFKVIVCGSSASWIIEKIINNKGGLYNRVTRKIKLEPFTLKETGDFLIAKGIKLNQAQILELYMVFGGIPHYLNLFPKGKTAQQIIDELCFRKNGELVDEFDKLFSSLFSDGTTYTALIRAIAKKLEGIGQSQLTAEISISNGGSTTKKLKELEEAGFIQEFIPHSREEKGVYYKVIDEYSLFYLRWIEPNLKTIKKQQTDTGYWLTKTKTGAWLSWSGYAFEAVCFKHLPEIQKALHIDAGADIGCWRYAPRTAEQTGCQIDLLFDRADNAVTICEIKYSNSPFIIDKPYAKTLTNKIETYQKITRTKKQIFLAMISANGLKSTMYSEELVAGMVELKDLFIDR